MKKTIVLTLIMALCFCNFAFAETLMPTETLYIYKRTDMSANKYLAVESSAVQLVNKPAQTAEFSAGNTTVTLDLPNSLNVEKTVAKVNESKETGIPLDESTKRNLEVANFLDDKLFNDYLSNKEANGFSSEDELISIANEVRSIYGRGNYTYIYYNSDGSMTFDDGSQSTAGLVGPNLAGLSSDYYKKDAYRSLDGKIQELNDARDKILLWQTRDDQPTFVYNDDIWNTNLNYETNGGGFGGSGGWGSGSQTGPAITKPYDAGVMNGLPNGNVIFLPDADLLDPNTLNYFQNLKARGVIGAAEIAEHLTRYKAEVEAPPSATLNTEIKPVEQDYHKYNQGSLIDKELPARSAEYSVISQCWGDCGGQMNMTPTPAREIDVDFNMNVVPANDVKNREGQVEFKVLCQEENYFSHKFYLRYYYAQDIPRSEYEVNEEHEEIISILTDEHWREFEREVVNPWINDQEEYQDDYDEEGNLVEDRARLRAAVRRTIYNEARKFVNGEHMDFGDTLPRGGYARIGVITEGFEEKDFFIYEPDGYTIGTTVFAQDPNGVLVGIKTGLYNDIFRQDEFEGIPGATDITRSSVHVEQENKLQYRLGDISFYLCEECSRCDEDGCMAFVASGPVKSPIGQYFSHYCGDHACRFVWEWLVDEDNPGGSQIEGLMCREKRHDYATTVQFCDLHECHNDTCYAGIVGLSTTQYDVVDKADARATGSASLGDYSLYCADHKCRWIGCEAPRIGGQETSVSSDQSPLCCTAHSQMCVYCGKAPIVPNDDNLMICSECKDAKKIECGICGEFVLPYASNADKPADVCSKCYRTIWKVVGLNQRYLLEDMRVSKAQAGIDGNYDTNATDKGFYLNFTLPDGTDVEGFLNTYRGQHIGFGYDTNIKNVDGDKYFSYSTHCAGNVAANMALANYLAGIEGVPATNDGFSLNLTGVTIGRDEVTGRSYVLPTMNEKGNCIYGEKISSKNNKAYLDGLMGFNVGGLNGADLVVAYNEAQWINVWCKDADSGAWDVRHSFMNTNLPMTYNIDGYTFQGELYINYGQGSGFTDDDSYPPDLCSFYVDPKTGEDCRVEFAVDEFGEYKIVAYGPYRSHPGYVAGNENDLGSIIANT